MKAEQGTEHDAAVAAPAVAPEAGAEALKQVFRHHPAGVAIITLAGPDGPVGFTATSVFSISADPPLFGFSVADTSSSLPAVERASSLVVNFLGSDQRDLAARFATRGIDRFAGIEWSALATGEPVLAGVVSWIRGDIVHRTATGGSRLVVVRATAWGQRGEPDPLVYVDRTYHRLGERSRLG